MNSLEGMKTAILCIIGLLGTLSHAAAEPLVEGRVRLSSGAPVPGAQVLLFDLSDLRAAPLAAAADGSGRFTVSLTTLAPAGALPERFELGANYPNPFNPSTIIPYHLPAPMRVRLEVFNSLGQRIATLVEGERPAGSHTTSWDATDADGQAVAAGVYLYRLSGAGVQATRPMLLIDGRAGGSGAGPAGPAAEEDEAGTSLYGLTVSAPGLVPYVDPAFRVEAGMAPLDVVVGAPSNVASAKAASAGILGDVDNTGRVDFFDALLVALYSLDASVVMPNDGDISLGDVNADGQVDLADAWAIAAWLNDPSDPALPAGLGEPVAPEVEPGVSLSPDPSTVTLYDDGAWHRFTVEAEEPVEVVANPGADTPRLEITTRSGRRNYCPAEADDAADRVRENGETVYLSGCASGVATVELRRESEGTVLRTYTFEVSGSSDLVVEVSVSDSTLTPGQSFTLDAIVRNQGAGEAAETSLRWYRSSNSTISTRNTEVGADTVAALAAEGTVAESISLTAPSAEGTYYYGACVVSVAGERGGNNCSVGARAQVIAGDEIAAVVPARAALGPTEAGKAAAEKIVAIVRGTSGAPIGGASWRWTTDERSGWVFPSQGVTGRDGRIAATWVAGSPGAGVLTLTAENRVSSITTEVTTESVASVRPPSGAMTVWINNPGHSGRAAGYSIDITPLTEPHGTYYAAIQWDGGYTGLQRGGDLYDRQLLFSVWDAPGRGGARVIESGQDVVCDSFGGEGTGRKCRLSYPWRVGDRYRFEVTEAELDGGSAMTLHVTELATGDRRFVGTIRYAARASMSYYGVFVEDYIQQASTCLERSVRSMAIRRSRAYINGTWRRITSGTVGRYPQDGQNPGTPPCANFAAREHEDGLEMVIGGRTVSDPDAPQLVIIP